MAALQTGVVSKFGMGGGISVDFMEEFQGPHLRYENNGRPSGRSPSISSGGKKINKIKHTSKI